MQVNMPQDNDIMLKVQDVEMTEPDAQIKDPDPETIAVVAPKKPVSLIGALPPYSPSPLHVKYKAQLKDRLLTAKKWASFGQSNPHRHVLEVKVKEYLKWRKNRVAEHNARNEMLDMPISKFLCSLCFMGPYARDEEVPEKDEYWNNIDKEGLLMCERPLGRSEAWTKMKTYKDMPDKEMDKLWQKVRKEMFDHLMEENPQKMHPLEQAMRKEAFNAWKQRRRYKRPTIFGLFTFKDPLSGNLMCTRASIAYMLFNAECGRYLCKDCCKANGYDKNLKKEFPTYCQFCYHDGRLDDERQRQKEERRRVKAELYKGQRPDRELVSTLKNKPELPHHHTTDRREDTWCVDSEAAYGHRLIKKPPTKNGLYSIRELDVFVKMELNTVQFGKFQTPYSFVRNDNPRHAALKVDECRHHFGEKGVSTVIKNGYFIFANRFLPESKRSTVNWKASQDDSDSNDDDITYRPNKGCLLGKKRRHAES